MNLIPPVASCPTSQCYEVVQICWADGNGTVTGCSTVPASLLTENSAVTLAELTPIIMAIIGLMSVAWAGKTLLRFLKII